METVHLGHYVHGGMGWSKSSTGGYTVNVYAALDVKEQKKMLAELSDIAFYESGFSLCRLTHDCFMDLTKAIERVGHRYLMPSYKYTQMLRDINHDVFKHLMNALGMFKSLRDHAEVSLLKRFGKGSSQLKLWREHQSKIYDSSEAYRLFHNLRNYCQHVGVPGLTIDLEGIARSEPGYDAVEVGLKLNANELLSSYEKWSAGAKKDLKNGTEYLSIISYINKWGHDICELINTYIEILRNEVYDSAVSLLSIRHAYKVGPKGDLGLFHLNDGVIEVGQHAHNQIPEDLCYRVYTGHDIYVGASVYGGVLSEDGVLTVRRAPDDPLLDADTLGGH